MDKSYTVVSLIPHKWFLTYTLKLFVYFIFYKHILVENVPKVQKRK